MKILIFSDVHFKLYSSVPVFNKHSQNGITIELERAIKSIDFIKEQVEILQPDLVICLGDYFHNLNINPNIVIATAVQKWNELYQACKSQNSKLIILNGNHDIINSNSSMIDILVSDYQIKQSYQLDNIYFLPYSDKEDIIRWSYEEAKANPNINLILTHYDFVGYSYNRYEQITKGLIPTDAKLTISGHIHKPQLGKNFIYVGSLYQQSVSELSIELPNGALLLTMNDGNWDYEFIENYYCGKIIGINLSNYDEIYSYDFQIDAIKLIVDESNFSKLDKVLTELKEVAPVWTQSVISKKKDIARKEINIDVNPNNILATYINHKYPEYKDFYEKYFVINKG